MRTVTAIMCLAWVMSAIPNGGRADVPSENAAVVFDAIVATVNAHVITMGDVLAAMASAQRDLMREYRGEELRGKLREAFDRARGLLIERKLIVDAFKDEGGKIPDWAVDREIGQIVQESFGGDVIEMRRALQADLMTEADWREMTRERLIVSAMRANTIGGNVRVAPRRIREYYESNMDRFTEPEAVRLRLLSISTDGDRADRRAQAQAALARLRAGEDFGVVAREVSDGPKASEGGDWGWVEPEAMRGELATAIGRMAAGDISDLIETDQDLYVVKVEERKPRRVLPFESVEAEIDRLLREEQGERLYRAWIGSLTRNAHITLRDVNVF